MRKKKIKGFIILMVVTMISIVLLNGAEAEAASKPKQTTVKTASASGTTSVKITVKKKSGVTGYQLRYSTKSSMKGSKTTGRFKSASKKISKLKAGTKYYVQVRTYKKTGKKYKYSGWSAKKSVVTKVSPTTIKSVNASGTTSVKVTVNKKSGVTGYQLRYSTSSGMKSAKSAGAFTGTSKTIGSLKAGTKYYIQVRTYKKIGSKKYYSTWSTAKSVTTKVAASDNSGSGGSTSDSGTSSSSGTTSGESNKNPEADSSSGSSVGVESEYSYEISLLPNKCGYYNNQNIAVYIKTDDPGVSYYDISGAEFDVITSSYDDIINDNYSRVSDGYVCILKFKNSGYQTLYINIFDPISGTYTRIPETEFTFMLQDYENSRTEWLKNTMTEVTDDSMTDNEKLTALMVYVRNHFVYDYMYRDTGEAANLYYYSGPWWVRDYNDCWDATDIMCYFADMLGLKYESTDASDLPGAGLWHTVATVYIDGTAYTYDATPLKQGYIDEWDILVQ